MSWGKGQFKKVYSRARSLRQENKDHEDDQRSRWCEYLSNDDYAYEMHPTLSEVAIGRLLTMLTKLNVKHAKDLLDQWYW